MWAFDWIASDGPRLIFFRDVVKRTRKSSFTKDNTQDDDEQNGWNSKDTTTYSGLFGKGCFQFLIAFRIETSLDSNNERYFVIFCMFLT